VSVIVAAGAATATKPDYDGERRDATVTTHVNTAYPVPNLLVRDGV
jgi:hypothetical protein